MKCPECGGRNFNWARKCYHCSRPFLSVVPRPDSVATTPSTVAPTLRKTSLGSQETLKGTARPAKVDGQPGSRDSWHVPLFSVGDLVHGRMRVESVLHGGMGVVYICRYLSYDEIMSTAGAAKSLYFEGSIHRRIADEYRYAAIKSFLGSVWHTNAAERFLHEANLWIRLPPHPHIVVARSYVPSRLKGMGGALLELEYVDGGNLRNRLTPGEPLPELETLRIALEFCSGMRFLFDTAGILHRDIKPENILLTRQVR
jgi:hypothetical protein